MKWQNILYVLLAISPLVVCPLSQWIARSNYGSQFFLWLDLYIYVILFFGTVVAIPVYIVRLILNRNRSQAVFVLFLSALFIPCFIYGAILGRQVRMHGIKEFTARSTDLVSAIHKYEKDHEAPPKTLYLLIPKYLTTIPNTGMAAYPDYRYHTGEESQNKYQGNSWALSVLTPSGGINFDMMLYLPKLNYPDHGYGGSLERIGDWAYVHE